MILVDTSVWIGHLRSRISELEGLLDDCHVLTHPMIVGELACGGLADRGEWLRALQRLPMLAEASHRKVLEVIESKRLWGRGIGFIDAHLLCAVLDCEHASLWTLDKRLHRVAEELGVVFSEEIWGND